MAQQLVGPRDTPTKTAKPVLLTVDDDVVVSQAITRDLRRQYAQRVRVVRADSGQRALEILRELRLAEENAALLLADHRMPGMTGIEFLEHSLELFPAAKRVLLTAYADINAASTPSTWLADYKPPFDGLRLIGHRWSARSHEIKDLLARNHVPFQWQDVETSENARELLAASQIIASPDRLPIIVTSAGQVLETPRQRCPGSQHRASNAGGVGVL
jgi:thioredoxin reductase (NADPH)